MVWPVFCSTSSSTQKLEMEFNWPLKGHNIELPTSMDHLDMMESFQLGAVERVPPMKSVPDALNNAMLRTKTLTEGRG